MSPSTWGSFEAGKTTAPQVENGLFFNTPTDRSPRARLILQSLQVLDTSSPESIQNGNSVPLDVLVSPALTHLVVDWLLFGLIPWAACTGLRELVLMMNGTYVKPGSEKIVAALEHCVSLQGLYLYGVGLLNEHAVRLQKLERLKTIACDVEVVEHLVPGRPVEHLRLVLTDMRSKPYR